MFSYVFSVSNLAQQIVKDVWISLQQLSGRLDIQGFDDSDSGVERREIPVFFGLLNQFDLTNCKRNASMCFHMGVSKNTGTPKWMVFNGKPY